MFVLVLLLVAATASMAHAQRGRRGGGGPGFSMLNISYEFIAPSRLKGVGLPGNPDMELEITALEIKLNLPPLGIRGRGRDRDNDSEDREFRIPRWMILHSLGYHQRRADYQSLTNSTGIDQLDRVNGIEYTMNLVLGVTRRWRTLFQLSPGLYSDLEGDISSSHWKLRSALLFDRVFDNGLTMGLGASWTTAFGEYQLMPVFHLETQAGINPHVRVLAPTLAEITWRTELGVELGAALRVEGGQYGLGEFMQPGASGRIDKLRYTNVTAGPFLAFRAGRGWSLMLEGGGTLHRRFETWRGETEVDDYGLKNASFFRIGLKAGI
jgi:hypothetical protein